MFTTDDGGIGLCTRGADTAVRRQNNYYIKYLHTFNTDGELFLMRPIAENIVYMYIGTYSETTCTYLKSLRINVIIFHMAPRKYRTRI